MHSQEEAKEAIKLASLYLDLIDDFIYENNREKAIYTLGQIHGLIAAANISHNQGLNNELIGFLHIGMEKLGIE